VSEQQRVRKHRHDGPDIAHHAESQQRFTTAIQFVLGTSIVLSAALIIYTVMVTLFRA